MDLRVNKPSLQDHIRFSLIIGLVCFILAVIGLTMMTVNQAYPNIWLANAAALVLLLRSEKNYLINGGITIILINFIVGYYFNHLLLHSFIYSLINCFEVVICFILITSHNQLPCILNNVNIGKQVLISILIGCLLAASINTLYFKITSDSNYLSLGLNWLAGDFLGMLIIMPAFLSVTKYNLKKLISPKKIFNLILLTISIAIYFIIVLLSIKSPLILAMLPLLIFAYYYNFFETGLLTLILMIFFIILDFFGLLDSAPITHYYSANIIHLLIMLTFIPPLIVSLLMQQKNETLSILRESEERFNNMLKYSTIGMAIVDTDGRWVKINQALCDMTQYSERELLKLRFQDITYSEDLKESINHANQVINKNIKSYSLEKRYIKKDKSLLWVTLSVSAIYDENNQFKYFLAQIENIDSRKRAEEEKNRIMKRLNLALETSKIGIWEYDFSHNHLYWDERMLEIYNIDKKDFHHTLNDWIIRIYPGDIEKIMSEINNCIEKHFALDTQFRIMINSHTIKYLRIKGNLIKRDSDKLNIILGITIDITRDKELMNELMNQKEKLDITLHSIGDAVIVCDALGEINLINHAAKIILNLSDEKAIGHSVSDLVTLMTDDNQTILNPLIESLNLKKIVNLINPVILINNLDQRYYIQASAAPILSPSGDLYGSILVFQDITSHHMLELQLAHEASHDSLTGLLNRHEFENQLITHLNKPTFDSNNYLCYMDLDKFKLINDVAGHIAGDNLLKEISKIIANQINRYPLARLGGDEFGLLILNSTKKEVELICQRIIYAINHFKFIWKDNIYHIGISIGIVAISNQQSNIVDLLSKADIACYTAKSLGKSQFCFYSNKDRGIMKYNTELKLISDITQALENNRFTTYAQKIISLNNTVDPEEHYEILLRIIGTDHNLKLPSEYILAAERINLTPEIDKMVVTKILLDYGEMIAKNNHLYIAINLSVDSVRNTQFLDQLIQIILATKIDKSHINFEITETAAMSSLKMTAHFIETIRNLGCTVSLDDFGSGISSYKYLKYCTVDFIKIDGSFIKNIATNKKDRTIVQSINDIAHQFGAKTIAEHVDSDVILQILKELKIDYAQGYLLHKPISFEAILKK